MKAAKRERVIAAKAPSPIGPYSVGIRWGELVFASGMAGVDPDTGKLVSGGIEAETRQALENLRSILEAGGSSLARALKTTVFLQDMAEFAKMNAIYAEFFPSDPPARSTVQAAALPLGARVEIEAVGARDEAHGD
jgi:2-iminobutanoate/2-iminopropanoate deaminase